MGLSAAGAGARASDAATAYFNPAGLTRVPDQLLIGGGWSVLDLSFTDSEGRVGHGYPVAGMYAAMHATEDFAVGFSMNSPYGGHITYDDRWTGRALSIEEKARVTGLQPAVAYQFTDALSIGLGVHLLHIEYESRFGAFPDPNTPVLSVEDASDWSTAYSLGALYDPSADVRLGLTYRTGARIHLHGDFEIPGQRAMDFERRFKLAQGINLSVNYRINESYTLLADVGWSDWSAYSRVENRFDTVKTSVDRHWHDTWRIGAGIEYALSTQLKLVGGASYDSSPVSDSNRLPDAPVDAVARFSTGTLVQLTARMAMHASYTFAYLGSGTMDSVELPLVGTVVDGRFDRHWGHFFGLSVSWSF